MCIVFSIVQRILYSLHQSYSIHRTHCDSISDCIMRYSLHCASTMMITMMMMMNMIMMIANTTTTTTSTLSPPMRFPPVQTCYLLVALEANACNLSLIPCLYKHGNATQQSTSWTSRSLRLNKQQRHRMSHSRRTQFNDDDDYEDDDDYLDFLHSSFSFPCSFSYNPTCLFRICSHFGMELHSLQHYLIMI